MILRPGCYQVQAIATLPSKIEFLITILRIQILILCTYRTGLNSRFSQNNKIQIPRTCRDSWWEKVQSFTVPAGHSRRWGNRWLGSLAGAVPTRDRLTTHLQRHGAHDTSPQQCSVLSVSVRYGDGLPCSWPRPTVGEIHVDGSSSSCWPFTARGLRWQGGRKLVVLRHGPCRQPANPAITVPSTVLSNLLDPR